MPVVEKLPPAARTRLKVMLGIHKGPSVCATLCLAVPTDRPVTWESGFTVILPNGQNIGTRWYPKSGPTPDHPTTPTTNPAAIQIVHTWGRITNMTFADAGDNTRLVVSSERTIRTIRSASF